MEPYKPKEPEFTGKNLSDFARKSYAFIDNLIEQELNKRQTPKEKYLFLLDLLEDVENNYGKWDGRGESYNYHKTNSTGIHYGIKPVLERKINIQRERMKADIDQKPDKIINSQFELMRSSTKVNGEWVNNPQTEQQRIDIFCYTFRTSKVPLSQADNYIDYHLQDEPDKLYFLKSARNCLIDNKHKAWKDNLEKFQDILTNIENRIKNLPQQNRPPDNNTKLFNEYFRDQDKFRGVIKLLIKEEFIAEPVKGEYHWKKGANRLPALNYILFDKGYTYKIQTSEAISVYKKFLNLSNTAATLTRYFNDEVEYYKEFGTEFYFIPSCENS